VSRDSGSGETAMGGRKQINWEPVLKIKQQVIQGETLDEICMSELGDFSKISNLQRPV
jgi:hypothetical protein